MTGKIFLHHLLPVFVFIFLFNRFRHSRVPLGYLYFLVYTVLQGIAAGTESFTLPGAGRQGVGDVIILFLRFALIEWFAYGLLAVATLKWTWVKGILSLKGRWEKVGRFFSWPSLAQDEKDLLIFGFLFLLVASFSLKQNWLFSTGGICYKQVLWARVSIILRWTPIRIFKPGSF